MRSQADAWTGEISFVRVWLASTIEALVWELGTRHPLFKETDRCVD